MITDRQVRKLKNDLGTGMTLATAAVRVGMSEKTARKYRTMTKLPSQVRTEASIDQNGRSSLLIARDERRDIAIQLWEDEENTPGFTNYSVSGQCKSRGLDFTEPDLQPRQVG